MRIQKELLKLERQKHQRKKESLQNVEVKKTPVGGLKAKLQRRKTKTSSVVAPTELSVPENKDSENVGALQPEPEKEGLKAKLLRRKGKKASDSAPPDSPIPEHKAETSEGPESLAETPTLKEAGGLKAKLQRRKNKQASDSASQESPRSDDKETEKVEQEEY